MPRPTLFTSIKFRRLVHRLGVPVPHALGYLECLWSVAYECGEPAIGDALDVELAAQWPGEPGVLAAALTETGFIDDVAGVLTVHDLWDHAPEYVKKRRERELGRQRRGEELAAEQQKKTPRKRQRQTAADNGGQCPTVSDEKTETSPNGLTPAPAPAPTPNKHPPTPSGGVLDSIPIPPDLDTPSVRKALGDWIEHRRQGRGKLTAKAIELAVRTLAKMGPARAVRAIEHSVANGWAGIFEPSGAPPPDTPADDGFDERTGCYTRPRRLTPEEQARKIAESAADVPAERLNQTTPAETGNATPEPSAA